MGVSPGGVASGPDRVKSFLACEQAPGEPERSPVPSRLLRSQNSSVSSSPNVFSY